MKKCFMYSIAVLMLTAGFSNAQSLEEYQRQQQAEMQKIAEQQAESLSHLQKDFTDYISKRDQEWADYLRKEWENYEAFSGMKAPERPKPVTIPIFKPTVVPDDEEVVLKAIPPAKPVVIDTPPVEPVCKPVLDSLPTHKASFEFHGRKCCVPYDIPLTQLAFSAVNQEAIANFWESASATEYAYTVAALLQYQKDMYLNDYAYLKFCYAFAENLYPNDPNRARLLTWFVLVRSGFGVRIAYQNSQLALLLPSLQNVYRLTYLNLGGVNYYVYPSMKAERFFTYEKDYLTTGRRFDFNVMLPIQFAEREVFKSVSFTFEDQDYTLRLSYDPDLIEFYKNYPQVDLGIYFNAAVAVPLNETLSSSIIPIIAEMDEKRAVSFILKFVQTAFHYKTDPEQFGREKYFFADELFYYPYSDCEDRSVLFAYLVRELLGLKVIGLVYSDHVAAAVAFTVPVSGSYYVYENRKYFVTDPTYINAPIGMSMPKYRNETPAICRIGN